MLKKEGAHLTRIAFAMIKLGLPVFIQTDLSLICAVIYVFGYQRFRHLFA